MWTPIRAPLAFFCIVFLASGPCRTQELQPADMRAVIVGVLEWQHGLQPYPKKNRKDEELRDLLVARGVPAANVAMLLDKDATLPRIRETVATTARSSAPGSSLLVYYAGHGMPAGDGDFCFANHELDPGRIHETGWCLKELGETLAREFHGARVLLFADCCYSGGLQIVVDRLHTAGIAAANLTSASCENVSTNNWTFTQSLIDGLRGDGLVDANDDGRITLGELDAEVTAAMRHLEGQRHGFKASGIASDFVLARSAKPASRARDARFPVGTYVRAPDGDKRRQGRLVAVTGTRYTVQFYDYSDKRTVAVDVGALEASTREVGVAPIAPDAGPKPDCEVEWQGRWWPAKVLDEKDGKYRIHYVGFDDSWDERVGKERIRFPEGKPGKR